MISSFSKNKHLQVCFLFIYNNVYAGGSHHRGVSQRGLAHIQSHLSNKQIIWIEKNYTNKNYDWNISKIIWNI